MIDEVGRSSFNRPPHYDKQNEDIGEITGIYNNSLELKVPFYSATKAKYKIKRNRIFLPTDFPDKDHIQYIIHEIFVCYMKHTRHKTIIPRN